MATAKKLPSGSWRCLVFSHTEKIYDEKKKEWKSKRVYESFTSADPSPRGRREVERMAAEFAARKECITRSNIDFDTALTKYIESREEILSPASIRKYKSLQRNLPQKLLVKKLKEIEPAFIQDLINELAKEKSPKSLRDIHGLISAVLRENRCQVILDTAMPKKVRPDLYIPSDEDIKRLIAHVSGTDMEIPVHLAAFGAMRRGEIAALTKEDVQGDIIHVCKTMVLSPENAWVIKCPKSYAGDRYVQVPKFVAGKISEKTEGVTGLTPNKITSRFEHVLKQAGIPHFRFHDLRHYCASISHALGIPDAYIMQMGGWGNDRVLKEVYRHTFEDTRKKMNAIVIHHFEAMQHEMQHAKK